MYELINVTADCKNGYHVLHYGNKNHLSHMVEKLLL